MESEYTAELSVDDPPLPTLFFSTLGTLFGLSFKFPLGSLSMAQTHDYMSKNLTIISKR